MDETYKPGADQTHDISPGQPSPESTPGRQQWLVDHVDWQKVVGAYLVSPSDQAEGAYNDASNLLSLGAKSPTELATLDESSVGPELERLQQLVTEQQWLRPGSEHEPQDEQPLSISLHGLNEWTAQTAAAIRLMPAGDRFAALSEQFNALTWPDAPLNRLRHMDSWLGTPDEHGRRQTPPAIARAIDLAASEICTSFDENDAAAAAQRRSEQTRPSPRITNAEILKTTTDIADPEAWVQEQFQAFPAWYYADLPAIHCVADDHAGDATGRNLAGHYDPRSHEITVGAEEREFTQFMERYGELSDESMTRAHYRQLAAGTLAHELSEYAWANTLSIAQRRRWLQVRESEQRFVSAYVMDHTDRQTLEVESEDFCETARMYMTEPDNLLFQAPARYAFAREFFAS